MIQSWQNAPDYQVLAERLSAIERQLAAPPSLGVGDWRLEQDGSGNLVVVNLRLKVYWILYDAGPGGFPGTPI